jgi:hypothetical protein
MNEKLKKKMIEYFNKFNDWFPTEEISARTDEDYIELIDKCIENNKDAYEMKMASNPETGINI